MAKKRLRDYPPPVKAVLIALGAVQIALFVAANIDISRRPASAIRGSKRKWRAICLLNTIGPLAYFRWGRVERSAN